MSALRHEMAVVWLEGDNYYLVHLPDFPEQTYRTHGKSYEEAARNGEGVLQLFLEEHGLSLPKPKPLATQ
ncbi:HicB family protein [filamentous cyanobacterium CCT1]|nr:HicB family protein [filamentous cyanobacterium CCT1]PSN76367.1 HicB family protein [filamentous cyanobacterium CCP4]